jgi:hypothetical protein
MPSLSSGATAEYHRSRQSHDSSVRSLTRPTLSDPHRREASDRRPPWLTAPPTSEGEASDHEGRIAGTAPSASTGRGPRRGRHTADRQRRSRSSHEDPSRTARASTRDRSRSAHFRAPSGRRWQATVDIRENPRQGACREQHASTTAIVRFVRSDPPTRLRREPVVASFVPVGLLRARRMTRHRYAGQSPVDRRRS